MILPFRFFRFGECRDFTFEFLDCFHQSNEFILHFIQFLFKGFIEWNPYSGILRNGSICHLRVEL